MATRTAVPPLASQQELLQELLIAQMRYDAAADAAGAPRCSKTGDSLPAEALQERIDFLNHRADEGFVPGANKAIAYDSQYVSEDTHSIVSGAKA